MDDQRIDDPAQTLTEVRRLRTRSRRRAHGGAWLPAAVLAVLVLLSAALYRYPFDEPNTNTLQVSYPFWAGLPDEQRSATGSYAFWLLGLPVAFAAIAAWYRYRARRLGVRVPWPVLVAVGLGALVLLLVLVAVPSEPLTAPNLLATARPPLWHGLATPLLAAAAAVVALGWVERAPGLAATGAWIGLLAWWQCAAGALGAIPRWLVWLLNGGSGGALGGQFGLRPAGMLLAMVGPLLAWVLVQAVRNRGVTR